ncbi:MAG: hypothetical protein QM765_38940 [Myxococcales bacterium]
MSDLELEQNIQYLLNALDDRLLGKDSLARAGELGLFVEDLHNALCSVMGAKINGVCNWHCHLDAHPGFFGHLSLTYDWRNIAYHPNQEHDDIGDDEANLGRENLEMGLKKLIKVLVKKSLLEKFSEALYEVQNTSAPHRAARELIAAIAKLKTQDAILRIVEDIASARLPKEGWKRLQAIPPSNRLAQLIRALANQTSPEAGGSRLLEEVADRVRCVAGDGGEAKELKAWLAVRRLAPKVSNERLHVVRVTLERDPEHPSHYLIQHAMFLPRHAGSEPRGERFPWRDLPREALAGVIAKKVIDPILEAVNATRGKGTLLQSNDIVLQLEVPPEMSCEEFESLPQRVGTFSSRLHCVTVKPNQPMDWMPRLTGPVDHPDLRGNSVRLETPLPTNEISDRMSGKKSCLFAEPSAWKPRTPEECSPVVLAFNGFPCAVLDRQGDLDRLLDAVFERERRLVFSTFLRQVNEKRRTHPVCVLWDDAAYDPALESP